jgi:hypothetical protein
VEAHFSKRERSVAPPVPRALAHLRVTGKLSSLFKAGALCHDSGDINVLQKSSYR